MKILWTFCIYNELELLPFKISYLRKNDIDPYIFDNMSRDGSWEWLQDNKIPSERFDSREMFDLTLNLKLLARKIHQTKPDWTIMTGADVFYVHLKRTLRQTIEKVNGSGFNAIYDWTKTFQFMYTGSEKPGEDLRLTYMYYVPKSLGCLCIAKYSRGLKFRSADFLVVPGARPYRSEDFAALHYSIRHDAEQRKTEQYLRRKKAWDEGRTARCYGTHYKRLVESRTFVFDESELSDVRNSGYWEPIKQSAKAGE